MHERISRREFALLAGGAIGSLAFGQACRVESEARTGTTDTLGRLSARPRPKTKTTASGEQPLGLGALRDGLLRLPPKVTDTPMPLLVLLHGASSTGDRILRRLGTAADDAGIAVLSPDSRGSTWDAIRSTFGPDVDYINRALEKVFSTVAIDPQRIAVGGFSDGASYALSLGLINGDLFKRIVAFSPGFVVVGAAQGQPKCFVSHGTNDEILPIDRCSRRIVPALRNGKYDVTYREFSGGHEMPASIVTEAMKWMS
jgi:predicted esterase